MSKQPALNWGVGIAAGVALGAGAWFLSHRGKKSGGASAVSDVVASVKQDPIGALGDMADQAKGKAGGIAKTLRDKATPLMQTIGDLVEKNAELVSAVANVSADQVRKTGQEIKAAAATLDKNLETLANLQTE